tara:strand:+ start:453 stop:842 length:390 start_codon:yes stop_codon:yes gene_type:complete
MIMKNKIVYDTSFIIRLFEKPLNISEPSTLLDGNSLILTNVIHELSHLSRKSTPKKKKIINSAISYLSNITPINPNSDADTDSIIVEYAKHKNAIVASLDRDVLNKAKNAGVGTITLRNDRVVHDRSLY